MRKQIIISALCIAILCTLFVGSASAVSNYATLNGVECRAYLTFPSSSSARAETVFGTYATSLKATATVYYVTSGVELSRSATTPGVNSLGVTAVASCSGYSATRGYSSHYYKYGGSDKTLSLSSVYY